VILMRRPPFGFFPPASPRNSGEPFLSPENICHAGLVFFFSVLELRRGVPFRSTTLFSGNALIFSMRAFLIFLLLVFAELSGLCAARYPRIFRFGNHQDSAAKTSIRRFLIFPLESYRPDSGIPPIRRDRPFLPRLRHWWVIEPPRFPRL